MLWRRAEEAIPNPKGDTPHLISAPESLNLAARSVGDRGLRFRVCVLYHELGFGFGSTFWRLRQGLALGISGKGVGFRVQGSKAECL